MPSAWIERRKTADGKSKRYIVKYMLGGRGTRKRYAGAFRTMREASIRKQWVAGELAALRVPNLSLLREPTMAPTFAEAARRWQASRVDVADGTTTQHRTAINRALPIVGTRRIDGITAH